MTTSAGSSASVEPRFLGPRITRRLLGRLADRAVTAGPRELVPVEMPATGTILGHVPQGTADDVAAAADTARKAQRGWRRLPAAERSKVLLRFAKLLLDRQDEVLDLIQLENGKARRHAFEEIIDVAQVCRYYARTAPRYLQPHRRAGAFPVLTRTWDYHHPKGVVGVISPWNYPLTLGISDALPALVAGNTVIAKPDSQTPYTTLWAAELLEEVGLPPGVLQVVTGSGQELGTPVIEHSDFVMFTGSTQVGRIVAAQAARRLIDYSMELGGKNAILILADADLGNDQYPGRYERPCSTHRSSCACRRSDTRCIIDSRRMRTLQCRPALRQVPPSRFAWAILSTTSSDIGSLISVEAAGRAWAPPRNRRHEQGRNAARPEARRGLTSGLYFYEPTTLDRRFP